MKAQFRFISGARAGQVESVTKAYIALGRHPLSDVRFDSERDLDVSVRHAAIIRRADGYVLRDLGSKNGTFVNGRRVAEDTPLANGDVVGFGPRGPTLEFRPLGESESLLSTADAAWSRPSRPRDVVAAVRAAPAPPRSSTAVRFALKEVARLRRTTKLLLVLLVLSIAGFGGLQWKGARDRAQELAHLRARADSLALEAQTLLSRFRNEVEGLREALGAAQAETKQLRQELERGGNAATVARLRTALEAAEQRQRALIGAAGVDYRTISRANQDAVVLMIVQHGPGQVVSGTGFAIDSQGTIITNRHVLAGEDGTQRPASIGVMFAGSQQVFRGELVALAEDIDIGVVRTSIRGGNPRVVGMERGPAVEQGDPVAMLGYPLGFDLPTDRVGPRPVADPTLTVGTVSRVLSNLLQVDGYGAPGSSGSPIFNRQGHVVGVLFGGQKESSGRIVYAVPSHLLARFLDARGLLRR